MKIKIHSLLHGPTLTERVLFATDMPFGSEGGRVHRHAAIEGVRQLNLGPIPTQGIFSNHLQAILFFSIKTKSNTNHDSV
jgi:hypothetical protein